MAQSLFQQAFEIASQLRASSPEDPVALRDLAVATLKMGIVEEATGEIKSAQLRFEDILNLVELLDKNHPATLQHRGFLAEALRRLGDISMRQGNTEKARNYYGRQLKASAFELAIGASPQAAREYSVALEREGRLALETDQFDTAARTYRELLKTRRQLLNLNRSGVQERRQPRSSPALTSSDYRNRLD